SFTIDDSTGWPDGSGGDFFVVIDPGTASEENVRCSARSEVTVTVATSGRGADGTSATSHSAGATVQHCFTALDADEANAHVSTSVPDPHPQYQTEADVEAMLEDYVPATGGEFTGAVTFGSTVGVDGAVTLGSTVSVSGTMTTSD